MKKGDILYLIDLREPKEYCEKELGIITSITDKERCIITDYGYQIETRE